MCRGDPATGPGDDAPVGCAGMRWEGLFDDLDAQWEAEERRDRDAEVADRTRRERAGVTLHARLAAHRGRRLRLSVRAAGPVDGEITDLGDGWVLLAASPGRREALVPLAAVTSVTGLGVGAVEERTTRRFGLGYALRALSRDRAVVRVTDIDGAVVVGTIDAVGADALDLAEHPPEVPRRTTNVTAVRIIPLAAVALVESRTSM